MKSIGGVVFLFIILRVSTVQATEINCKKFYESIYQDNRLDVLIAYGYKDSRPFRFVGDRHERLRVVQKLVKKCNNNGDILCDFQRVEDDSDHFFRHIELLDGSKISVQVDIINSSVGVDDERNRSDDFQKWKSKFTKKVFLNGFKRYEVIFYNGHSRTGGGPDFTPPLLTKEQDIDYTFYKKYQPGINAVLSKLHSEQKTSIFGLFSCASTKYFNQQITDKQIPLNLISSPNLLYHSDANFNLMAALRGLIRKDCPKLINQEMRAGIPKIGSEIISIGKNKISEKTNEK